MALSVFADKAAPPDEQAVAAALGPAYPHWTALRDAVALPGEWGFTGKSTGWGLRLKKDNRIILYMTPREGHFLASLVLGEKAVQAAHDSGLPEDVLKVVDSARRYAEGRGVRFEVRTPDDVENIRRLAAVKLAN